MKYCFVKKSYNWLIGIYERDSEIQETKQNLFIKSLVNILVNRNTYRVQGHDIASIRLNAPISVFFQIDLQRNIIRKQKF